MAQKNRFDPFVYEKKTVLMQRLADLVRTGHTRYMRGEISAERAGRLADKFARMYDCDLDKMAASRARAAGRASTRLLLWQPEPEADRLVWFLVATPGEFPLEDASQEWRDAMSDRQRVELGTYELVRITKPVTKAERERLQRLRHAAGDKNLPETERKKAHATLTALGRRQQAKGARGGLSWTWRYTREANEALRLRLVQAIRDHRDDQVRQIVREAWRTPGFAGARDQVLKLPALIKGEWKRTRSVNLAGVPETPARLGYVQRLPDAGHRLSVVCRRLARAAAESAKPPEPVALSA